MPSPIPRPRVAILGVGIDAVTIPEAVAAFAGFIEQRQLSLVFNVNVDILMKIRRDEDLQEMYRVADMVLVDGTPMMWAARFLGSPLPERVSGSDFVPALAAEAARRGYRIFLFGGLPGVAEQAKEAMERLHPGVRIVGTFCPPFGFEHSDQENLRALAAVQTSNPDVLLVALGAPKQEKWLFRFRDQLRVPVAMGVGSTLDYYAGRLKRAPRWMQHAGLEWAFRLAQEPRRLWRRYLLEDPPFVREVIREKLRLLNKASRSS